MAATRDPVEALGLSQRAEVERKLAAVLFVDLVHPDVLVVGVDPEVARRRLTEFFDLLWTIIERHDGTVESFAGDPVMAGFGIPRAHGDDAERALRAAFEICATVEGLGVECRAGIEAGEVVSDSTGSTFATGEAVNAAARLQQLAGAGEILVGAGAHGLAAYAVELEPGGSRSLRGFSGHVQVWGADSILECGESHT